MTKKENGTDQLITQIINGIEDVKGQNIEILDLREIENTVCDYFIICNGTSNTQVNAIVSSIEKKVSKALKEKAWHIEGAENAEWILMDYVHVVVHVFQKHIREYYDIESLWGDAKTVKIETSY
ncbi:MAG: ribosome silencing factor [Bacteroidetes bacterium HGW-Bacteroidetes-2]|jgi:ribosome-associated protein|nr:ribosome silencing factor [Flavobacteriia bacterium]OIP50001.1 MAG: ribosome silencing factor [Flavobacteriaceae bacterium CG2_30_34_30]PIQ19407.1 MAG: ribosome silencing factor [Flavobacteriaceae bacterium CG18_big_fil_WC_8_21_14_2_50_34_36]PIV51025.1 MAG: ribosome silencing factor [Flavobacteriaceae bacterium CG02_land_8_20_14_3_00_34_13]PIX08285.1 MAG: ribosome silencing factor [Flavobacteriaceae bacterium CG_4_8_14_3_um_filter_34_10]PIZ06952.1 MAG: ribosome silencing factor [Flavobacter